MSPISSYNDYLEILKDWSEEYFWWVCIDWYYMNDRSYSKANFSDLNELGKTINLIHKNWSKFNLRGIMLFNLRRILY